MKKIIYIFILISNFGYCQMLESEDVVIEIDLGYPNIQPITSDPSGIPHGLFAGTSKPKSFGQYIIKGEFFMSDNVGLAVSFNYGYWHTYDEEQQDYFDGTTGLWTTKNYYYETKVHKTRLTAGLNFHLTRTERLDSYIGVQGGGKKAFGSYSTNDPNAQGPINVYVFPFALRVHFGARFFFNDFLAANMELGLGGPTVSLGATYKF